MQLNIILLSAAVLIATSFATPTVASCPPALATIAPPAAQRPSATPKTFQPSGCPHPITDWDYCQDNTCWAFKPAVETVGIGQQNLNVSVEVYTKGEKDNAGGFEFKGLSIKPDTSITQIAAPGGHPCLTTFKATSHASMSPGLTVLVEIQATDVDGGYRKAAVVFNEYHLQHGDPYCGPKAMAWKVPVSFRT